MPIPIPEPGNGKERRPLHALARENAEALNALLTREVPVLTQQLQQTMELMNHSSGGSWMTEIQSLNSEFSFVSGNIYFNMLSFV